jgi:hypothetical protein
MVRALVIAVIVGSVLSVESPTACIASEAEQQESAPVVTSQVVDCQSVDFVSLEGRARCPARRPDSESAMILPTAR